MSLAALALLALLLGLLAHDWATSRGRNRRWLVLQTAAFALGGFFIASPDSATALAHAVGIGRGVDFLLYPLVIWLVRESLLSRRARLEDHERMTALVRALALLEARSNDAHSPRGLAAPQSAGDSAETTS